MWCTTVIGYVFPVSSVTCHPRVLHRAMIEGTGESYMFTYTHRQTCPSDSLKIFLRFDVNFEEVFSIK